MCQLAFVRVLPLLVLFVAGCGGSDRPPVIPVRGSVLLDGQPVQEAAVMFVPVAGGRPAQGATDAAGKFQLTTFEENDGALVGAHRVSITKIKVTGVTETADGLSGTVDAANIQQTYIVPQKYSLPETSGLTTDVAKGMKEVTFQLQSE